MRQIQIDRFGSPEVMVVRDVADPLPGAGEVVVRVRAAGCNPIDYKIRDGSSGWALKNVTPESFPLSLGREACGVVESVGAGVDDFAEGDLVFGMMPMDRIGGCYAEKVAMPVSALSHAPENGDPVALGGLALAGTTAWVAVHDLAEVRAGGKVLVQGGAGGVGQIIVQLCVAAGAQVWATASTKNQERLAELGATPIDYTTQSFAEVAPLVDVVIDCVYFHTFLPSLDQLVLGGRIVVLPSLADLTPAKERGVEAHIPTIRPMPRQMEQLALLVVDGTMSIEVSEVFPLDQAADAHRDLESGHTRGKIVLDPAPEPAAPAAGSASAAGVRQPVGRLLGWSHRARRAERRRFRSHRRFRVAGGSGVAGGESTMSTNTGFA